MKIYSYLQENIDILGGESDLLDKIKLLLVGDFFQKKKIYTPMMVLDKIKTILTIPPLSPSYDTIPDIESGIPFVPTNTLNIGKLIPLSETLHTTDPSLNILSFENQGGSAYGTEVALVSNGGEPTQEARR